MVGLPFNSAIRPRQELALINIKGRMKKVVIGLALIILTACAPRYISVLDDEQKENIKEVKEIMSKCYKISPAGKLYFEGGYLYWDEKGITFFVRK